MRRKNCLLTPYDTSHAYRRNSFLAILQSSTPTTYICFHEYPIAYICRDIHILTLSLYLAGKYVVYLAKYPRSLSKQSIRILYTRRVDIRLYRSIRPLNEAPMLPIVSPPPLIPTQLRRRFGSRQLNVKRHAGLSIHHGRDDIARLEGILRLPGREAECRDQEGEDDFCMTNIYTHISELFSISKEGYMATMEGNVLISNCENLNPL